MYQIICCSHFLPRLWRRNNSTLSNMTSIGFLTLILCLLVGHTRAETIHDDINGKDYIFSGSLSVNFEIAKEFCRNVFQDCFQIATFREREAKDFYERHQLKSNFMYRRIDKNNACAIFKFSDGKSQECNGDGTFLCEQSYGDKESCKIIQCVRNVTLNVTTTERSASSTIHIWSITISVFSCLLSIILATILLISTNRLSNNFLEVPFLRRSQTII